MANTVTTRTISGSGSARKIVNLINISSDGTEETDLVIYDNSAFVADTSKGNVQRILITGAACTLSFEWDQTTDSPICHVVHPGGVAPPIDFRPYGGVSNPNATGATGDVVLTTANLDSGDLVTILIEISQV